MGKATLKLIGPFHSSDLVFDPGTKIIEGFPHLKSHQISPSNFSCSYLKSHHISPSSQKKFLRLVGPNHKNQTTQFIKQRYNNQNSKFENINSNLLKILGYHTLEYNINNNQPRTRTRRNEANKKERKRKKEGKKDKKKDGKRERKNKY